MLNAALNRREGYILFIKPQELCDRGFVPYELVSNPNLLVFEPQYSTEYAKVKTKTPQ